MRILLIFAVVCCLTTQASAEFTFTDSSASGEGFSLSGLLDSGELVNNCTFRVHVARKKSHLSSAIIKNKSNYAEAAPVISLFTNATIEQLSLSGSWSQIYNGLTRRPKDSLSLYARAFIQCNNANGQKVKRYSTIGKISFSSLASAPKLSLKKLAAHMLSKRDNF